MVLTNKAYDILRWIVQYFLPGAATLYFALAQIWGLPEVEKVVGTLTVLQAFIGILIGVSAMKYDSLYSSKLSAMVAKDAIPTPAQVGNMVVVKLTGTTYESLKWFAQLFLPSFAAFLFGLSQIWAIPYAEQIVATIAAVSAFLGVLLGVSSSQYRRGLTNITTQDCDPD